MYHLLYDQFEMFAVLNGISNVQNAARVKKAENKNKSVRLQLSSGDEANNIYGRLAHLAS